MNGNVVGETRWQGLEPRTASFSFPQHLVDTGSNRVDVEALRAGGLSHDYVYVDGFDLTVRRAFESVASALLLRPDGNPVVTASGFADGPVDVFDVSDPWRPVRVTGSTLDGTTGSWRVSFAPSEGALRYAAVSPAGRLRPRRIAPRPAAIATPGRADADLVILTVPALEASARRFATYRESQGTKATVVLAEDVYDTFSDGMPNPHAVTGYLRSLATPPSHAPRWVLLAGAGTWDYKDVLGYGPNLVPPLMVRTSRAIVPSDNVLGDLDGDGVPEIAIGRVPARTEEALDAYVDKVMAYEDRIWTAAPLLLADVPQPGLDFSAQSDSVAEAIPADRPPLRTYLDQTTLADARAALSNSWRTVPSLVHYLGHGGFDRLGAEGLLTSADVPGLPAGATPVVAAPTCFINDFAIAGYSPLGIRLVGQPGGGAVAVWAASGLADGAQAPLFGRAFVSRLFAAPDERLGDAILDALRSCGSAAGAHEAALVYTLLGDPSLRVAR